MSSELIGRTAIITGASRGLGLEISRSFINAGANIVMVSRDEAWLDRAQSEILSIAGNGQRIEKFTADISIPDDVHKLVRYSLELFNRVDILVNNAGVYGPKGRIEEIEWAEWIQALQINLIGCVLLCREILPSFKEQRSGKIIQLSGGGATSPMPMLSAYAVSKAAIVRFVETLAEEVRDYHIDVNAIAPGALNTRLLEEILEAGPEKVGQVFYERSIKQKQEGGTPFKKGADLAVFLASTASNGITGKLISAVWDPWEDLPEHIDDLKKSDIYTLRRIVPGDRGMTWGER
jgi:NAD(P)-dependent dehydrogenase (short-subunit alcohol dehydrogenase family)